MRLLLVLLLSLSAPGVLARGLRSLSVPIYEDTAAPGTSSASYSLCDEFNTDAFAQAVLSESTVCATKTTYSWQSSLLPTATERRQLCACTELIAKLQVVKVPRCSLVRGGNLVTYAKLVEYAFGLCSYSSSSSSSASSGSKNSNSTPQRSGSSDASAAETDASKADGGEEKSKTPLIIGIAAGVVVVCIVLVLICRCRKKRDMKEATREGPAPVSTTTVIRRTEVSRVEGEPLSPMEIETSTHYAGMADSPKMKKSELGTNSTKRTSTSSKSTGSTANMSGNQRSGQLKSSVLWEDPSILAVRIPHDAIFFGPLLSRGGYGEVYKGTYKGETVAIKQLLPGRRKDMNQIDLFMAEVKLMSSLEHERIVRFIGVAWNSLSDVCMVVEYMENGDLRSVLARWDGDEERRPNGFDADKTKIALHIAHALTYLHSLQPVVVHRDLKSKNILLDNNLDAKLTDFGVSRERADSTMTAGVGSSLWMAPEVMLGERYDEKADVFSFGVVLSELDTHKLPYSHAKESGTNQKVPDAAILQMVSLGRLSIEFTECADEAFVQLGRECVALDPKQRPTSAQVLHRVHQLYRQYL